MKKFEIIIIFLALVNILTAQEPQSPELHYVTVREDSLVQIYWNHLDTQNIDGFIIKRVIYDGSGVVYGTMNNIEIISNTETTNYIDTSNAYSTFAKPYTRAEKYSVNSYLYRNDSLIYSNMTLPQKTIFFKAEWDYCNKTANFNWSKYIFRVVEKYQLLYGKNLDNLSVLKEFSNSDTNLSYSDFEKNKHYYFTVRAILKEEGNFLQDTSYSNYADFITFSTVTPDTLINIKISAIKNNYLEISFYASENLGIKKYQLIKKINSNDSIIKEFDANTKKIYCKDKTNTNEINKYYLQIIDLCDSIAGKTDFFTNYVLDVKNYDKSYHLKWTDAKIYEQKPEFYNIKIKKSDNWEIIKTLSGSINKVTLPYSTVFKQSNYNEEIEKIKFQISAKKDTLKSFSNIVEIPVNGIFAIPNTFFPNSLNQENRYFTIKAKFIKNFSMIIHSEQGNIIFKTNDLKNRWDGRYSNGKLVPQGAYIYSIKYTDNSGKICKKNGVINVIY